MPQKLKTVVEYRLTPLGAAVARDMQLILQEQYGPGPWSQDQMAEVLYNMDLREREIDGLR